MEAIPNADLQDLGRCCAAVGLDAVSVAEATANGHELDFLGRIEEFLKMQHHRGAESFAELGFNAAAVAKLVVYSSYSNADALSVALMWIMDALPLVRGALCGRVSTCLSQRRLADNPVAAYRKPGRPLDLGPQEMHVRDRESKEHTDFLGQLRTAQGDRPDVPMIRAPTAGFHSRRLCVALVLTDVERSGWYHGTHSSHAASILIFGIDLDQGTTRRDFSRSPAFYVTRDKEQAVQWARLRAHNGLAEVEVPAVLVYDVPVSDATVYTFPGPPALDEWRRQIRWCRPRRQLPRQESAAYRTFMRDKVFLEGLVSRDGDDYYPLSHQVAALTSDAADLLARSCTGCVFYDN